jgi:Family of unknown function (DUF6600)
MTTKIKKLTWWSAVLGLALATVIQTTPTAAQDQGQYQDQSQDQNQDQPDDPPSRVARLGYMEGSVSFQPAGEPDWVQAVANRPMTTGDKLWADKDSRAELQLGSAVIRLNSETGFSFLNIDDNTVQIQLTAGALNIRVRELDQNAFFEVDTPNLAFSITQPGSYRVEASEDGNYTVVSIRDGGGQATGNGQTYTLHAGQSGTFSGTDSLNADVVELGRPDPFDNWADSRDHRYDDSRSAQYVSREVVGYEDLDDYGDWRDNSDYGHIWYPRHVEAGWAPYHDGHWVWISPWGYTWVDDSPWGYAPFHYGRWVVIGGRWGWVAGPIAVRPVYAPALVVFIGGGGVSVGFGGNVGWFPLGPREVYMPSYRVSRRYVDRVNISNTNVTNVQITNVYNTTIINKTTNITNVTYVNRNVRGAVTAVPQRTFVNAQPVRGAAVRVNERDIARASLSTRAAYVPTRDSVLGARASTAGRVSAPPQAVMNRQVVARRVPPPPPVPFARQQQALQAHPGQPLARSEVRKLRPADTEAAHPMVRQAPVGRPTTPNQVRPGQEVRTSPNNQPGNRPGNRQPGNDRQGNDRQGNDRPGNDRPGMANPTPDNRPADNRPAAQPDKRPDRTQPTNRPADNRPTMQPDNRPDKNQPINGPADNRPAAQPDNRPDRNQPSNTNRPDTDRSMPPPSGERPNRTNNPSDPSRPNQQPNSNPNSSNDQPRPERPAPAQPTNRPNGNQPSNRPQTDRPLVTPSNDQPTPRPNERPSATQPSDRPDRNRPEPNREQPAPRPDRQSNTDRPPQQTPPPDARPAPQREQPRTQTPQQKKQEEKKQEDDRRKHDEKPPGK